MAAPRSVTPLMAKIRNLFLQRDFQQSLRYKDTIAPRDGPAPNLPLGVTHKLSDNYYVTRDARRTVEQPAVCYDHGKKVLASGEESVAQTGLPRPGYGYSLETGRPNPTR